MILTTLTRPIAGKPPRPRVPGARRSTLSNGLRLATVPRPGLPQVTIRLTIPAGSAADPAEYPGTASLVGDLLTEGTARFTARELNERLDALGASVNVQVGHDFAHIYLVLLSETLREGVDLLGELVIRPTFPSTEVERARAETVDLLASRVDEPANVADDRMSEEIFGADHPYGRLSMGTAAGVQGVPAEVLVDFHRTFYRPGRSFIVAAGDFVEDDLRDALEEAFEPWEGTAANDSAAPHAIPAPTSMKRVAVDWPDAAQSQIRVGGIGLARKSPDWIPASVANFILGGSTITGRLGANLREDKGWTYGVRSGFAAGLDSGGWAVETAVDVEVAEQAVQEIVNELSRMVTEPVDEADLRRAKDAIILSLPRAFETPGRIVSRLAALMTYDLPVDYWETYAGRVEEVTADEVQRIASQFFDPDRLVRVVVG
ncbi:MAG TPA: pitrilysin family protein [Longimicrobiaceae bacterium]|nr:pitrilysin family protein [Longimicrobiaceae bacterium]